MKQLRSATLILLAIAATFFALRTYHLEQQKINLKYDLIELSKIKYGLFNDDEWKEILGCG